MTAYLLAEAAAALRSAPEWFPGNLADRAAHCRSRRSSDFENAPIALSSCPAPSPLIPDNRTDIDETVDEAVRERAAIQEFDGALTRGEMEHRARTAMRVFRYRLVDDPDQWAVLIAPRCDLAEAERCCRNRFGAERVIEVRWHGRGGRA